MRLEMYLDGPSISMNILMPEKWLSGEQVTGKTVWLLHDKMDLPSDWLSYTQAELFAEQAGVAFVCLSTISARYTDWVGGCTWEKFFTQDMWEYVHEIFPVLSAKPEDNALFGYGRGGFGAIKYALVYPEKYGAAYSIALSDEHVQKALQGTTKEFPSTGTGYECPEKVAESNDNLAWLIQRYAASKQKKPMIYMADQTESPSFENTARILLLLQEHGFEVISEKAPGASQNSVEKWFFINHQLSRVFQK